MTAASGPSRCIATLMFNTQSMNLPGLTSRMSNTSIPRSSSPTSSSLGLNPRLVRLSLIFPLSRLDRVADSSSAWHSTNLAMTFALRSSGSAIITSSLIIAASATGISDGENELLTTVVLYTPRASTFGCSCRDVSRVNRSWYRSCQLGTCSDDSISSQSLAAAFSTFSIFAPGTFSPAALPPPLCAARRTSSLSSLSASLATSCTTWISGCISPDTAAMTSSRMAASMLRRPKSPDASATCTYAEMAARNDPSNSSRCFRITPRRTASLSTTGGFPIGASLMRSLEAPFAIFTSSSSSPGMTSSTASSTNIASTVSLMIWSRS